MGRIFCIMGKSSSGKDSIYRRLLADRSLPLARIVPYTTRPRREGEQDGREYVFTDEAGLRALLRENRVIEQRVYHTVYGDWYYFTVDDGSVDLLHQDYLYIVTPEGYGSIRNCFGKAAVVPIYIEVEDGERLSRALSRERQQKTPRYEEMCRRFLSDAEDFSEEKLRALDICDRFVNRDLEETVRAVTSYIRERI